MLRNSHSPSSSRDTPIVTRSYSRLTEIAIQKTPTVRSLPNTRQHIKTVERNHEIADDDDEDGLETTQNIMDTENDMNSSKFIYKQHFSAGERLHMFWISCKGSAQYSWKTFRRQFVPGIGTVKDIFLIVILAMIAIKYVQDNVTTMREQSHVDDLKSEIDLKFHEMSEKYHHLTDKLDHLQKIAANPENVDSKFFEIELKSIKEQIDGLKHELGDHKYIVEKSNKKVEIAQSSQVSLKTSSHVLGVNVANSLIGAKIDEQCSSRTVSAKDSVIFDMVSYFMSFKDGYVLLDREILQPGEAWCTYDNRASLTITLAKSVRPTSVSYQHVKWNGIVPNNAPKTYDVVACHSPCCSETTPLATNCTYDNLDGHSSQEQFCSVENRDNIVVDRVQFRFKENQGNMTKTCAYLVRVYGTIVIDAPISDSRTTASSSSEILLDYSKII